MLPKGKEIVKIGFDARMIEHSGIGNRIQKLLEFWKPPRFPHEFYIFGNSHVLSKYPLPKHAKIVEYNAPIYSLSEMLGHRRFLEMDLLEIPHFNVPFLSIRNCIVTIHDLIPYLFPEYHKSIFKRIYLFVVLHWIRLFAKKVLSVSETTKMDLVKHFGFDSNQISVVYNSVLVSPRENSQKTAASKTSKLKNSQKAVVVTEKNFSRKQLDAFLKRYYLPKQYFLYVGIGKGHKNIPFLMETYLDILSEFPDFPPLVWAGTGGNIPEDLFPEKLYLQLKSLVGTKLFLPKRIPSEEWHMLYRSAILFLFPSLYEGFGFPPLEAQANLVPVLSSPLGSLSEVLGESAMFFDSKSQSEFREKWAFLYHSKKYRDRLVSLGKKNVLRYSWDTSVVKVRDVYESLVSGE